MTHQTGRPDARPPAGLCADGLFADGVSCRRGERLLFAAVTLHLVRGNALHVAGPNGVGKTTLLRALAGLTRLDAGVLSWDGAALHGADRPARVAYLGHPNALKEDFSALENLRYAVPAGPQVEPAEALDSLEWIGLGAQAGLPVRLLSQGQRRRVALARLRLARDLPLWLLDEPFAALDRPAIAQVVAMLEEQRARGGIVVYTTHDDTRLQHTLTLELDGAARARGEAAC